MAGELCTDTTALIHFEAAGKLGVLKDLCCACGDAHTTAVVVGEWHPHEVDPAGHVRGHPWLRVLEANHPDDLLVIKDLARRYPTPPDKNQGEMDVVAVSKRYGMTALMEDGLGCKQANDHGVPHIAAVTLLAAGVAFGRLEQREAWRVHKAVEATRGTFHSILIADKDGRRGFAGAVAAFKRTRQSHADLGSFVAQHGLDNQLIAAARIAMNAGL